GLQVRLPEIEYRFDARRQRSEPLGIVRLPLQLFLARFVDRRHAGIDHRAAAIGAEFAGKGGEDQLGFAALERPPNPVEARVNDLVRQLEVVEPLAELGEFLFLALLQVFCRLLVTPPSCITFREQSRYRQGWV